MTIWIIDRNGNKASPDHFGSKEAAQAALDSLVNCKNCENCIGCTNCTNCKFCRHCTNCTKCDNCRHCRRCKSCVHCISCKKCKSCMDCYNCVNCKHLIDTSYCERKMKFIDYIILFAILLIAVYFVVGVSLVWPSGSSPKAEVHALYKTLKQEKENRE